MKKRPKTWEINGDFFVTNGVVDVWGRPEAFQWDWLATYQQTCLRMKVVYENFNVKSTRIFPHHCRGMHPRHSGVHIRGVYRGCLRVRA